MYKLEYLPIALQDIIDTVKYISNDLHDSKAAQRLAKNMTAAANETIDFPYANPVYIPMKPLKHEYRKLIVQNFLMFYWIDEKTKIITIARVIYAPSNYNKKLK